MHRSLLESENEQLVSPFEGLDIYSTQADLAIAEIRQRLLEAGEDDTGTCDLLAYQLDNVTQHLGEFYPDYPRSEEGGILRRLGEEKRKLERSGVHQRYLDAQFIIMDRASQARWRLSGVDPESLDPREVDFVESVWSDAADKRRGARLAALEAEVARLVAENQFLEATTGKGIEDYIERREQLYEQMKGLRVPRSSGFAGWGDGSVGRT